MFAGDHNEVLCSPWGSGSRWLPCPGEGDTQPPGPVRVLACCLEAAPPSVPPTWTAELRGPQRCLPCTSWGHTGPWHARFHPCSPPMGPALPGAGGTLVPGRAPAALQLGRQALGAGLSPHPLAGCPPARNYTCLSLSFLFRGWDNSPYLPGLTEGLMVTYVNAPCHHHLHPQGPSQLCCKKKDGVLSCCSRRAGV